MQITLPGVSLSHDKWRESMFALLLSFILLLRNRRRLDADSLLVIEIQLGLEFLVPGLDPGQMAQGLVLVKSGTPNLVPELCVKKIISKLLF